MPISEKFGKYLLLTTVAAIVLVAGLAAYNADYLFHTRLYETATRVPTVFP